MIHLIFNCIFVIVNHEKTYLVQRGDFVNRKEKQGIDSIIMFDYMGSIEFEHGVLNQSLKRIRNSKYSFVTIEINNKSVTIYCRETDKLEVIELIHKLAVNQFHTKEYTDFNNYINPTYFTCSTDFWWDIGNDFMWWKTNKEFENKFKNVI